MKFPERYRMQSTLDPSLNCYEIPFEGRTLRVIASNWGDWEHVSVSLTNRTPNWREMSFIKDLFWDEEEECIQFHPKRSQYVNIMEHCLHIWKPPIHVSEMLQERIDPPENIQQSQIDQHNSDPRN